MAEELSIPANASPWLQELQPLFKNQGVGIEGWNDASGIRKGQAM